jgi:hypothetical protein
MANAERRGEPCRSAKPVAHGAVDLVAETTRAFFVPCAQIGLYVCVAPGEFGKQTDPLMPICGRSYSR